jgi:hypothetical protein
MSNYSKITNFAAKDALSAGDPNKIATGTSVDNEFSAIQTAVATKADDNSVVHTTGNETIAGDKTLTGAVDLQGTTTFSDASGTLGDTTLASGSVLTVTGVLNLSQPATITVASDTDLGTAGNRFVFDGGGTINGIETRPAGATISVRIAATTYLTYAGSPSSGYLPFYLPGETSCYVLIGDELEFVSNGGGWIMTKWVPTYERTGNSVLITANDTFYPPPGVKLITISGTGGGGGGAGCSSGSGYGGGGGGGAGWCKNLPFVVSPANSYSVTIGGGGGGGVGDANGYGGGTSSFGSGALNLTGGGGGKRYAEGATGGAGGTVYCNQGWFWAGMTNGFAGGNGGTTSTTHRGAGGSDLKAGEQSASATADAPITPGTWGFGGQGLYNVQNSGDAVGYGCGGGGASYSSDPGNGGDGSPGFFLIQW